MRPFAFHPATSVSAAVALLAEYGDDAQILSGGTSLMLLGKLGLSEPEHVVGLRGIDALRGISVDDNGGVRIGALTTLREIETSEFVRAHAPGLAEAVETVATIRIRNQATIGGNLAHADPAQDAPPMLMALDASVAAEGTGGTRTLDVEDLLAGFFETTLEEDELVTSVFVPRQPEGARSGYLKFLPRTQDDYATVSVAATIAMEEGRVSGLRVVLGAVGSTPIRARELENALIGNPVDPDALADVAPLVAEAVDPVTDARGSADYKRAVAGVCARRLLARLSQEG